VAGEPGVLREVGYYQREPVPAVAARAGVTAAPEPG
jgi:hypothetical protein